MNQSNRSIPAIAIVGCLVVLAAALCVVVVAAAIIFLVPQQSASGPEPPVISESPGEAVTVPAAIPNTPTPTTTADSSTGGSGTAPDDLTATPEPAEPTNTPAGTGGSGTAPSAPDDPNAPVRSQIEANVVEIRGLSPREPIVPTLLTQEQLRQRIETDLFEDYDPEQARHDTLALSAFDFVQRDFDLYSLTLDLYTEQIAGFYDPETAEFVVISEGEQLGVLEQWTHAHEFTHALQDQYFALELLSDETIDSEAYAGLQALAEGDATLVQLLYLTEGYFTQDEMMQLMEAATAIESPVLDSAPPIIARDLEFPYVTGLEFVQTLHAQGGFDTINDAWENPPQSTEHILHPDRYLAGDIPQIVSLAPLTDTLGAGWQWLDEDTFGEFYLRQYLLQRLPDGEVDTAATGWGGDQYAVHWNEDQQALVMALRSAWDTPADANEFDAAYTRYAELRQGAPAQQQPDGGRCWQATDTLCLYRQGDQTLIILAPDLPTAATLATLQLSQ
jgi:hypothetical protein